MSLAIDRLQGVIMGLVGTLSAASCGSRTLPPTGQILLYVDTDAPVPPPPGTPDDGATVVWLFDTVRIELYDEGGPIANGSEDFPVDSAQFAAQQVSVGIVPTSSGATPLRARIRMFRRDRLLPDDEPPASVTLDTTVALPSIPSTGVVPVTVTLRVDDLGAPPGTLAAPAGAVLQAPSTSLVDTWSGGKIVGCGSPPADGQACVPGGAFWFGDPAFRGRTLHNDIYEERLVTLSPFKLLLHEVTVAEFREVWPMLTTGGTAPPMPWSGQRVGVQSEDWCTWVETPDADDVTGALPLDCVSWTTARAYCQIMGMDLPTEAQFEFIASGSGREWGYPWGVDAPACGQAIWGQAGADDFATDTIGDCRAPGTLGWMDPPGSGLLDRVGGAERRVDASTEVIDLGGNLSEWSLDQWSRADEAYWSAVRVFVNPIADLVSPGDGDVRPVRAGSWAVAAASTRAAFRLFNMPTDNSRIGIGFRCAGAGG